MAAGGPLLVVNGVSGDPPYEGMRERGSLFATLGAKLKLSPIDRSFHVLLTSLFTCSASVSKPR